MHYTIVLSFVVLVYMFARLSLHVNAHACAVTVKFDPLPNCVARDHYLLRAGVLVVYVRRRYKRRRKGQQYYPHVLVSCPAPYLYSADDQACLN